jgi:hypothetical protein
VSIKENYCEQSRVDFPLGTRTMEIKTKSQTAIAQEARRLSENDLRRLLTNFPWPPKEGKASSFPAPLFDASN